MAPATYSIAAAVSATPAAAALKAQVGTGAGAGVGTELGHIVRVLLFPVPITPGQLGPSGFG